MENIRIKEINQTDNRTLKIKWTDDREQLFDVVELRRKCPCASCIDEWTRKQILRSEDIKDDVRPVTIESVGRYAMKIQFSDGHNTGIYTFESLRNLR